MKIVLISTNVLFTEVLSKMLKGAVAADLLHVAPEAAQEAILNTRPDVILVDEGNHRCVDTAEVLETSQSLPNARVILLSLQNNDVVVLDSYRATIRKVEDLLETIRSIEEARIHDLATKASVRMRVYGFLANLCNQRPDMDFVRRLRKLDVEGILVSADQGEAEEKARSGLREISSYMVEITAQMDDQVAQALTVDWTRLFRGVRPGYGPPPPYEGLYAGGEDLKTIQAVAREYRAHGVEPVYTSGNRPDYIGLELAFLRHVCEQQAEAAEKGDGKEAEHWHQVEEEFLNNHLGKWVTAYCSRALAEATTAFYRGSLYLLDAMIAGGVHGRRAIPEQ